VVNTCLMLLPPQLNKRILDDAIPHSNLIELGWLVLGLLSVQVVTTVFSVYNGSQLSWLGGRIGTDIRYQVFQAVEKLSMRFFDKRAVGQVMSRVMNDSGQL